MTRRRSRVLQLSGRRFFSCSTADRGARPFSINVDALARA